MFTGQAQVLAAAGHSAPAQGVISDVNQAPPLTQQPVQQANQMNQPAQQLVQLTDQMNQPAQQPVQQANQMNQPAQTLAIFLPGQAQVIAPAMPVVQGLQHIPYNEHLNH